MKNSEIDSKLAKLIIRLHESGYDRDFTLATGCDNVKAVGEPESASEVASEFILVRSFCDRKGCFVFLFTIITGRGCKGILLSRLSANTSATSSASCKERPRISSLNINEKALL